MRLKADGKAEEIIKILTSTGGVESMEDVTGDSEFAEIIIHTSRDARSRIMERLAEKEVRVRQFGLDTLSLEDIFLKYVGGEEDESNL